MRSLESIVEPNVIAETHNPEGHRVIMDAVAWDHVLDQHVEMSEYLAETMLVVEMPDYREPDPARVGRERYFRQGGPTSWMRVVTELTGDYDRVVTAFPQSNAPRELSSKK